MNENSIQNQELSLLSAIISIILCIAFGANAVAVKMTLTGMGAFTSAALRFSISSAVVILWALITRRSFRLRKNQARQLLIFSIIFTVQFSIFYYAMNKTHASHGTLIINLQHFFLLFLAHFFIPGDRITARKFLGILLGITGIIFVFLEARGIADFQTGDILILIVSFIWAADMVYIKRIIHTFQPFHIALYSMLFSIPFLLLEGYMWDETMIRNIEPSVLYSLLYQSLITGSIGFVAWHTLLQKYGAVSLHFYVFIMPIAGVYLSDLLLDEPITENIILALIFIVLGIFVIHLKRENIPILSFRKKI